MKTVTVVHERLYPSVTTVYRDSRWSFGLWATPQPKYSFPYSSDWNFLSSLDFSFGFRDKSILHLTCFLAVAVLIDRGFRLFGSASFAIYSVLLSIITRAKGESVSSSLMTLTITSGFFLAFLGFVKSSKNQGFSENGMKWLLRISTAMVVYAVIVA